MPIYEYKCGDCGAQFEYLLSRNEKEPASCGECGGHLERMVSRAGFNVTGYAYSNAYGLHDPKPESKPKETQDSSDPD